MIETPPDPTVTAVLATTGAHVYYEVRGDGPGVLLVGCPMDATAFAPLADLLAVDHTVITTDPRGINRSSVDDPEQDVTPEMLADDLSQLLSQLSLGPVAVFGSSGGAVSALALAQAHPDQVHTVVAHEPPLEELLDDRAELRAVTEDIVATYLSGDVGGAWGKFLASANITLSDEDAAQWASEPTPQAAADELFFFAHTMRPSAYWLPDVAALRTGVTRIIVGLGDESTGQICERTSKKLATSLGISPISFPGDHVGFTTHAARFAERLTTVLSNGSPPKLGSIGLPLVAATELAAKNPTSFPNESNKYREARNALLAEEIELRRHLWRVAEQRRRLPPGGEVPQDYEFDGKDGVVRLSNLFGEHNTLIVYSMMYGPTRDEGCPMCSSMLDAWDGEARHIQQRAALAIVARSPIDRILDYATERNWTGMSFYSDPSGDYTSDYVGQRDADWPAYTVFQKDPAGTVRHFYSGEGTTEMADPGQDPHGAPDMNPLWVLLDTTPDGRGTDWYPTLDD